MVLYLRFVVRCFAVDFSVESSRYDAARLCRRSHVSSVGGKTSHNGTCQVDHMELRHKGWRKGDDFVGMKAALSSVSTMVPPSNISSIARLKPLASHDCRAGQSRIGLLAGEGREGTNSGDRRTFLAPLDSQCLSRCLLGSSPR